MKRILIAILLMLPFTAGSVAPEYSVSHLGVERGLSNNHIVSIAQDKQGFIWIATDEGLNRFDGHTFKTYFKEEDPSSGGLTGNELNAVLDDPRRPIIWIATQRAGLNGYDYESDTFISYRHKEGESTSLVTDDVTALTAASDGGIWVATFWGGIDHFDPDSGIFTHYNSETVAGLPGAPVWSVADGNDGFLYVGHEHAGFSIIDLDRMTAHNFMPEPGNPRSLPSGNIHTVYRDSVNNIWLGSGSGPVLFNQDDSTFTSLSDMHPSLDHPVVDIRQFGGNQLWMAMESGGVAVIDLTDSIYTMPDKLAPRIVNSMGMNPVHGDAYLSSPSVRCLFEDNYHNVWAGSWGGGLNLISMSPPAFRNYATIPASREGEVFSTNSVLTVLPDGRRHLWIGRDGGGLTMLDDSRKPVTYTREGGNLPGDVVQASYRDRNGDLWFGFFQAGAGRFNPLTKRIEQIFPSGKQPDVRDITGDSKGNIILGTSEGVYVYDPSTHSLKGPRRIGNNLIRKVFALDNGGYLIGTFGSGLLLTDSAFHRLRVMDIFSGLPSNTVNDIFRSRDGTMWVATGEGLLRFDDFSNHPDSYTVLNRAKGLGNSHVQAVTQDRSGNIWVSTNGGISCVQGDSITNYSYRDRVPLGNFLGRSVASDPQGNLYFGGISGLCMFNPRKVLEEVTPPEAVIVELSVLSRNGSPSASPREMSVRGKEKIQLNAGDNSFDLSFTTRNMALAGEVEYAWQLEGFDNRWTVVSEGNRVSFRDLPAGSYTFHVKTRLRNQAWGEPTSLKIVIRPPFWLSWWAWSLYVVIALAIVGGLLYLYQKRVRAEALLRAEKERSHQEKELNDERLRFYTNITHELRTPLTLIVGPIDDLARDKSLPERERKNLEMVNRNTRRLLDLVNRILEFRKTETQNRRLCVRRGNLAAVVYEVALKYKELNRRSEVVVSIDVEPSEIQALFDKEVVTVVIDNLMSNAMKYTPSGQVSVKCRAEAGEVRITVSDTGVGIAPQALDHIFERYYQERGSHQAAGTGIGLALVKNLVTLHHGSVSVTSEVGEGTEFVVTFPLSDSYPEALHTEEVTEAGNAVGEPTPQPDSETKPMVLVVEDNADIRDYIRQSFTDLYDIRCAGDGREGLEMAQELIPAIIVSDVMMPVMDGVEMTRRLKGDLRTSHIPVILLTAKESESDRAEGYKSGADSYLTKPFSSSLLQSRINNLLLQRLKLTSHFSSRPAPAIEEGDNSIEAKREKLKHSLSEVDREFVDKLTRTITDNLPGENVDVNFVSDAMCMSTSTLYRKVKAITGISPNEYIRKTKMQLAERYMLEGNCTLAEISFKIGINSVPYFRQCFKEEFGMTPSDYLKRISSPEGGEQDKNGE